MSNITRVKYGKYTFTDWEYVHEAHIFLKILFKKSLVLNNTINFNYYRKWDFFFNNLVKHGLRTPDESINQRYLKNPADVACNLWPFCVCQCILFCIPVEDNPG